MSHKPTTNSTQVPADLPNYAGDGRRAFWDDENSTRTPDHISGYIADSGLENAVNVALTLNQPLLLTGEPGSGKTQLAHSVAYQLGLGTPRGTPLIFNAKTTSTARDLFYHYDALRYFQSPKSADAGAAGREVEDFIEYQALGLAILRTLNVEQSERHKPLPARVRQMLPAKPVRSVVLIDEVDKAPRDLPNDILNEIETMSFLLPETGQFFQARAGFQPVVILTSNSEKNLPDAFLRRCVYYHIEFPGNAKLAEIVRSRIGPSVGSEFNVAKAVALFDRLRTVDDLKKKPATAELIQWVRLLIRRNIQPTLEDGGAAIATTLPALAKTQSDAEAMRGEIQSRVSFAAADEE